MIEKIKNREKGEKIAKFCVKGRLDNWNKLLLLLFYFWNLVKALIRGFLRNSY